MRRSTMKNPSKAAQEHPDQKITLYTDLYAVTDSIENISEEEINALKDGDEHKMAFWIRLADAIYNLEDKTGRKFFAPAAAEPSTN